jgi:hypothetical protein
MQETIFRVLKKKKNGKRGNLSGLVLRQTQSLALEKFAKTRIIKL